MSTTPNYQTASAKLVLVETGSRGLPFTITGLLDSCFRKALQNSGVSPRRGCLLRHSREACPVLRYGDGNLKPFFQGIAALQTAFLDSCFRRNDGEGNSCEMTLWVIQSSPCAGMGEEALECSPHIKYGTIPHLIWGWGNHRPTSSTWALSCSH